MQPQLFAMRPDMGLRLLILGVHHRVVHPELLVEDQVADVLPRAAFDFTWRLREVAERPSAFNCRSRHSIGFVLEPVIEKKETCTCHGKCL